MKNRTELINNLSNSIQSIKRKKKVIDDIKLELAEKYNILAGDVQQWINNPEMLLELDIRELYLITEQVYLKTGNIESINPNDYFTDIERNMARNYEASLYREKMELPITLKNVMVISDGVFLAKVSPQIINDLVESQILVYDYEIQREAVLVKGKDGTVRKMPKIIRKNVEEIEQRLLEGTLAKTTPPLVWNALVRSSDTGNELEYNPMMQELTINSGTELAIADGFHRISAIKNALMKNKDVKHDFMVILSNFSKKLIRSEQSQVAKATPISTTRVQEWESKRYSDSIVQQLRLESDLKGKISQTNRIRTIADELVSYNVLADTIDEQFIINTRAESSQIGDFLVDYFNMLIGSYPEEFIGNPNKTRESSLLVDNNMFVGYIVLARRLYEKNIKPSRVVKIINSIDFNKSNKLWVELGVINSDGKIERDTVKLRKNIKKYFEDINIDELVGV